MFSACRFVIMKVEITAFSTSVLFTVHEDTLPLLLRLVTQPREPSISCLVTTSCTPVAQRRAHSMSLLLSRAVIVVVMLVEQCFCIVCSFDMWARRPGWFSNHPDLKSSDR